MLKNSITCLVLVLSFMTIISAKDLGPDVSVYDGEELKWENGAYGYHVMFKSLLDENGDCVEDQTEKIYTLDESLVPPDAFVAQAFLIWTGAQPVDKIDESTDSEVTLNFKSVDGNIDETKTVTATGYKVSEPQGFEFDSFIEPDDTGRSYFTYRVDITDFFESIHEIGREFGVEYDGESLFGDYTLSDFACVSDEIYSGNGTMVSNWAIVLIYSSYSFSGKAILLFDDLYGYEPGSEINLDGPICPSNDFQEPGCIMLSNHGSDILYDDNHQILKWTLTNLLISSMDVPSSNFDIPNQPELVACTPANIPFNPENPDGFWCVGGEHTFAIRIQNWGDSNAENIIVKTEIPKGMEYIRGTTEYATEFFIDNNKKIARERFKIPDIDGNFPLKDGFNLNDIASKLSPCPSDSDYLSCEKTILVRFKTEIKDDIKKTAVIESSANIDAYSTNHGMPLKLRLGSDCDYLNPYTDLDDCGGLYYDWNRYCSKNEQCWEGECCSFEVVEGKGVCVTGPCNMPDDDVLNDIENINDSDSEAVLTDEDNQQTDSKTKSDGCAITNL